MTVCDLAGRRIATLVDGERPSGPHEIIWQPADDKAFVASQGAYVYRLEVGDMIWTRIMSAIR